MKIGLCYDTKSDYGINENDLDYTDFVSLQTVSEIRTAIQQCGHDVGLIGNAEKLKALLRKPMFPYDLIFNICEGFGSRNREAIVPALAEAYHIPCTASDVYGMAININKSHTKILLASAGIPIPKSYCFYSLSTKTLRQADLLGYPLVLKPNCEGGSMGLALVHSKRELLTLANFYLEKYKCEFLVEEYIAGAEITIPVIGNKENAQALGVVTILHEDGTNIELYDSALKYEDNIINSTSVQYPEHVTRNLMDFSVKIHRFFDLRDYSRMDFRVTPDGGIFFLEINAMPSLCRGCSFEQCGKAMGLEYYEVIGMIIDSAIQRYSLKAPGQ